MGMIHILGLSQNTLQIPIHEWDALHCRMLYTTTVCISTALLGMDAVRCALFLLQIDKQKIVILSTRPIIFIRYIQVAPQNFGILSVAQNICETRRKG